MKKITLALIALFCIATSIQAKNYTVTSPSGALKMVVNTDNSFKYTLYVQGSPVLTDCHMSMELSDGTVLGTAQKGIKDSRGTRSESISAPLYRQSSFLTKYNYLNLRCASYTLQVRAYNDGVAYRFVTNFPSEITVKNETVEYNFAQDYNLYVPYTRGGGVDCYESSFEAPYTLQKPSEERNMGDRFGFLPAMVDLGAAGKILLTESDIEDYPGQFLGTAPGGFKAVFAPVPATYRVSDKGVKHAETYSDFIAKTSGSRTFPWRIIAYGATDNDLALNNMTYQTASECRVEDTSWILAGQSTWDWWTANTMYNVDFKCGINTDTYKYYIDFASAHKIPYVIVDEGWYKNFDLLQIADGIDIEYLLGYAQESGVRLILWSTVTPLCDNLEEVCRHYSAMGLGGFKVDFFDSHDQVMVNNVYEIARVAAKYHLILDFHGMYKPAGLNRTYPNVLNFEGVNGMEQCKWASESDFSMPPYDCQLPFIRQVSGPMDYTQGGLRNETRANFKPIFNRPLTQGTRAHQVALYVVFESPLAMLADSPSDYLKEKETLDYIHAIPTVCEKTILPAASFGNYVVTARYQKGKWYVGGITNWDERDITLNLSFLGEGSWKAKIFKDGENADMVASDYSIEDGTYTGADSFSVHMAPGGGFAIIFEQ